MDFDLSEEQAMIRDSAERAVRHYCELGRRRARIARGKGFDAEFWAQFAELGWTALALPEVEGGLGGSMTDLALLMVELGRGASSEPIVSGAVICASLLAASGWNGRAAWIDRALSGEGRLAFAGLAEGGPDGGVRLVRTASGAALEGDSLMVFDAEGAEGFLVMARDGTGGGPVLVLVPAGAPGLGVAGYPLLDGSRAADLCFAGVPVVEDAIVARGDAARLLVCDALAAASMACQAAAVGSMEACLEMSADYAGTRVQFGQPIGRFQAIQHMLADMLVAAHNARSMLYFALSRFEAGRETRDAALALSGRAIGGAGLDVSRMGLQVHGGYGMTDEFTIGHHHRFLFVMERRIAMLPSIIGEA